MSRSCWRSAGLRSATRRSGAGPSSSGRGSPGVPETITTDGLLSYGAALNRAGQTGIFDSFLQPVDRPFPMVATRDVGNEVARLLSGASWEGRRMGLCTTPNEVAAAMAKALDREVVAKAISRSYWDATINAMGVPSEKAGNWAEMQDGFNSGWIDFGRSGTEPVAATTTPTMFFAGAR